MQTTVEAPRTSSSEATAGAGIPRAPAYLDGWFAVGWSDEIAPGAVKPLRAFGRDLVLFRDDEGAPHVLDAYCPHLGAHLGVGGRVEGKELVCPFHAWRFHGDGKCVAIPYARKVPPNARVGSWLARDVNGYVMVYNSATGAAPAFEIAPLDLDDAHKWRPFKRVSWTIKTRQVEIMENAVDKAHFLYVHSYEEMPTVSWRAEGHVFESLVKGSNKILGRKVPTALRIKLTGAGFGEVHLETGAQICIVSSTTPVDDDVVTHRMSFYVHRSTGRLWGELLGRATVRGAVSEFESDIPIWESKCHQSRPVLCDGDGPIMLLRKWYAQYLPGGRPLTRVLEG